MDKKKWSNISNTIAGLLLTGVSFLLLLWESWVGILVIGMIIATIGEMVSFPFSNKFALNRSKKGRQGAYMGLYTMAFSMSHIFGHSSGMQITEYFGFQVTWYFLIALTVIAWVLLYLAQYYMKKEPVSLEPELELKLDK